MSGTRVLIVLAIVMATAGSPGTAQSGIDGKAARAAFERFKSLAGDWDGKSTAGWTGASNYTVIGRGSAILNASIHSAHPGDEEGMATVYHLDGDRLLLTHYCVARNQPRLVATKVDDDGRRVEFTFLDGTNLSSRNAGHMDRAVFEFHDANRFSSRWTWYQDGQERWMEDITYTRRR